MIGQKITSNEAARDNTQRSNMLHDVYFWGQRTMLPSQLSDIIRGCDQMLDRLQLRLVYIIESIVQCHHTKTLIDLFHLEIDDDMILSITIHETEDILMTPYTSLPNHTRSPRGLCINTMPMHCPWQSASKC